VEIKCQLDATDEFLLQILVLAQHVSGTIMPIIGSSRVLYKWLLSVVFGAWFSSCRYSVELRVVCPVCGLLLLGRPYWILHSVSCQTPEAVTTVFKCSWGWTQKASETCRVLLQLLINILLSCITLVLYVCWFMFLFKKMPFIFQTPNSGQDL
jgi:hypothetical protein